MKNHEKTMKNLGFSEACFWGFSPTHFPSHLRRLGRQKKGPKEGPKEEPEERGPKEGDHIH